ncbi:MAG: TRAP transporter TatT component family protein [Treponema sp.]|nr:TRAP transporter TatT component family protein [Treponema sp.]
MTGKQTLCLAFAAVFCLAAPACSINKIAVKAVSNALAKEGSSDVFTSDSDPRLVGEALPFTIKMYESLLQANPEHQGLLRTTGSLFVMYANAFVQKPAEQLPRGSFGERRAAAERAGKLYLRGMELLYRGLELKYPGFEGAFENGCLPEALSKMKKDDVPSLYWAAAAGLSVYSINPLDPGMGLRVSEFLALISRAYELDPGFNSGALDDLLLLFYASVPESMGGDKSKAELHFRRALEKSKGLLAGPYVSYAQAVSIPAQDYDTFKECLEAALAVDPDADPPNRLVNVISRQKARYLLDSASQFFINTGTGEWDDEWDGDDW